MGGRACGLVGLGAGCGVGGGYRWLGSEIEAEDEGRRQVHRRVLRQATKGAL